MTKLNVSCINGVVDGFRTNCSLNGNQRLHSIETSLAQILIQASQGVLGIIIVLANLLIVAAVMRLGRERLPIHFWIAHVACADTMVGLVLILKFIINVTYPESDAFCRIIFTMLTASFGSSVTGLAAMSILCYINVASTIVRPKPPKWKTLVRISAIWFIWFIIGALGRTLNLSGSEVIPRCVGSNGMFDNYFLFSLSVIVFLHMFVIGYFQIKLFLEVKSHVVKMAANNIMLATRQERKCVKICEEITSGQDSAESQVTTISKGSTQGCIDSTEIPSSGSQGAEEANSVPMCKSRHSLPKNESIAYERWRLRVQQLGKLTSIFVGLFTLCWLPYAMLSVASIVCDEKDCPLLKSLHPFGGVLNAMNCLVNVLVYSIKSAEFRSHFKKFLKCS